MTDPELTAQWHPTRNGAATPDHITHGSHRLVWWQCPSGHEWESTPNHRKGHGCPYCTGRLPTPNRNFAVLHPELAAQSHPTRNGDRQPHQVTPASSQRVWWQCQRCGHDWQAKVNTRSFGTGCPVGRNLG